jgi:hypothetical protein
MCTAGQPERWVSIKINMEAPEKLDDAKVIEYAFPSCEGFGVHRDINGNEVEISSIAVATYGDDQFYLFSCDSNWNVIGDLVYDSVEEAKDDALRWYAVSEIQWNKK